MTETDETVYDFDAWLEGAGLATTSVEVLQNPDLISEYEAWERRYARAQAASEELSAGEKNPVKALEAEGEALLHRIERSRSTWHLRALTIEQQRSIVAAFPDPEPPTIFEEEPPKLTGSPTEAQAKAYTQGWEAYRAREQRWLEANKDALIAYLDAVQQMARDRGAEKVVRSLVRIEQDGQTVTNRVTVEQVQRLAERIGDAQVKAITDAIDRVSVQAPEVPIGPLSHGSGDSRE